ncbi:codeine O-demethylase-like [Salvia splendens]|uniref:codeine O-demethylase-like n=1 Tax=Salvia splendens TaxID=180675 RepID=UPI001C262233|nr:codeine O-demethylase-like [Salvia splendens]
MLACWLPPLMLSSTRSTLLSPNGVASRKRLPDEVRHLTTEFFHLPELEKQRYTRQGNDVEGLHLLVAPEDGRKLKYWPQNPEPFRKALEDYSAKIRQVEEQILRSIAKTLSLTDEDYFLRKITTVSAQFNYYPPCSKPDQDRQVRGPQLLQDNQWLSVPITPQALLVLAGDLLEIMSNGIFKSPMHRVVINSKAERKSVAMFLSPNVAEEIEPLDQLVDEERPKMFKKVTNYAGTFTTTITKGTEL